MANYYCEASSLLALTSEQIEEAKKIAEEFVREYEEEDQEFFDVAYKFEEEGLWIHSDEGFNPDLAANFILHILEKLEIDEPFVMSWAYTCSKPRLDSFGGGAFVVQRGYQTIWVDAKEEAHRLLKERNNKIE